MSMTNYWSSERLVMGIMSACLPLDDIAETEWTDTYMGITTVLEDDDVHPKSLNYPVRNLQPGWHQIGFKASDKGGRWSPGVSVNILVTDGTNLVFVPLLP